jgi:CheY-like chemotaxis protein
MTQGVDHGSAPQDPERRRVLLVEDELLVAMTAVDSLNELGYDVAEAATARAALDQVQANGARLEFAVVDLGLPDRPGEALISEIRALQPRLPIIVASGYSEDFVRRRIAVKTDIAFLGKPYDLTSLQAAIATLRQS